MKHDQFINQLDDDRVLSAIAAAEARTRARIGLVVSRRHAADELGAARRHHKTLKLDRTPGRNNVLIFVAPRSQTFSIYADAGAHAAAEQSFWDRLRDELGAGFKEERFTDALVGVITKIGDMLAREFPKGN